MAPLALASSLKFHVISIGQRESTPEHEACKPVSAKFNLCKTDLIAIGTILVILIVLLCFVERIVKCVHRSQQKRQKKVLAHESKPELRTRTDEEGEGEGASPTIAPSEGHFQPYVMKEKLGKISEEKIDFDHPSYAQQLKSSSPSERDLTDERGMVVMGYENWEESMPPLRRVMERSQSQSSVPQVIGTQSRGQERNAGQENFTSHEENVQVQVPGRKFNISLDETDFGSGMDFGGFEGVGEEPLGMSSPPPKRKQIQNQRRDYI